MRFIPVGPMTIPISIIDKTDGNLIFLNKPENNFEKNIIKAIKIRA